MRESPPNIATDAPQGEIAVWSSLIPDDQWDVFATGTGALADAGVTYLLAGALALATSTGHWRNTKDVDVIVHEADGPKAIQALRHAGFDDYYERQAYDRTWIFRGFKNGVLFDVIWALPNHRVQIDGGWFARAQLLTLRGRPFAAAPAEELVRVKLYVMQRERCDWVDVLNVLAGVAHELDWPWLVRRMGRDLPLLHAALALFNWLCPARAAAALPAWVREQFALPLIAADDPAAMEARRVALFDSRPWFAAHQPVDQPLER